MTIGTEKILWGAAGTCIALCPAVLLAHLSGPPPGYSGAPMDHQPLACASLTCHSAMGSSGPINNYPGHGVSATFSTNTYIPGGPPVTITVTVTDPVNIYYGFQMTARLASGAQAGDFTPGANQIVVCSDDSTKIGKSCPASAPVEYIEHFFEQAPPSKTPYTFTWTPPATDVGPVTFYVAGNAVDNAFSDVADAGDHVSTNNYVLSPAANPPPCTISAPVINGVVSASAFGALNTFAPGSWLEIYGSDLSPDTRGWVGADFNGSNAPISLDGVSVSINNKPGFISYIKSDPNGQVNVQAPAESSVGPMAITVTNCAGTSAPFVLNEARLAPGILAPPSFSANGKQYVVAQFADGTYVGNLRIPGLAFRPAKPGDTITTYGIGFGPVDNGSDVPGVLVGGMNQLTNPLLILFGQTPAPTPYYGLAPSYTGLYQFNITVPPVPDGDLPVTFTIGGAQSTQTMYLTVSSK